MEPVPLTGGAYQARSLIANAQRSINLYAELNQKDAPFPFTYYPTPGLLGLSNPPASGVGRGLYRSTTGQLYAVVGAALYRISNAWVWTSVGTVGSGSGPVCMADNGTTMLIVDGTATGYRVTLSNNAFATIADDAFYGSKRIDVVDGYFVLGRPGTNQWYISRLNDYTFDPLDIALKMGFPDPIAATIVRHREIWVLGEKTAEVWYNTGAADFTYGIMPGVFVQFGLLAAYSVAGNDLQIFWLGQDQDGQAMVLTGLNYQAKRISTHAIENTIQGYATLSDAVGFCYQQGGHTYYLLNFPTADATWVYDVSTDQWHQRASIDDDGVLHMHRATFHAACYGKNLTLDPTTGRLYAYDLNTYADYYSSTATEVPRIRGFPHLMSNGVRVQYQRFLAEMEVGNETIVADPDDEKILDVWLRWSDDRGRSFGNPVRQTLGSEGEYKCRPTWNRLGIAQDRVYELAWSVNKRTALNGAFVSATPLGT